MKTSFSESKIYVGNINHRRFSPKAHSFNYSLFMLALDVHEVENTQTGSGVFGFSWYHPLRFVEKDYLKGEPFSLSQRIKNKVRELHGHKEIEKIVMLVQVRSFGVYFSPANFYFCYNKNKECTQMLAEVSNTPWNERHYYWVDLQNKGEKVSEKSFQVSPFMDLDMSYYWHVRPPSKENESLLITIENKRKNSQTAKVEKLFDVKLMMNKQAFTKKGLLRVWCQLPIMSIKVVSAIYWQALKIFLKRIPFIGYQKSR